MRITVSDWVVFLYNFGVVLSGGYVVMTFNIDDRVILFGLMFVFAFFWTVYFKFYMRSRLETIGDRGEPS